MLAPIFSKMQESWLKVGHAAKEMLIVFSMTFSSVF